MQCDIGWRSGSQAAHIPSTTGRPRHHLRPHLLQAPQDQSQSGVRRPERRRQTGERPDRLVSEASDHLYERRSSYVGRGTISSVRPGPMQATGTSFGPFRPRQPRRAHCYEYPWSRTTISRSGMSCPPPCPPFPRSAVAKQSWRSVCPTGCGCRSEQPGVTTLSYVGVRQVG